MRTRIGARRVRPRRQRWKWWRTDIARTRHIRSRRWRANARVGARGIRPRQWCWRTGVANTRIGARSVGPRWRAGIAHARARPIRPQRQRRQWWWRIRVRPRRSRLASRGRAVDRRLGRVRRGARREGRWRIPRGTIGSSRRHFRCRRLLPTWQITTRQSSGLQRIGEPTQPAPLLPLGRSRLGGRTRVAHGRIEHRRARFCLRCLAQQRIGLRRARRRLLRRAPARLRPTRRRPPRTRRRLRTPPNRLARRRFVRSGQTA